MGIPGLSTKAYETKFTRLLELARELADNPRLQVDTSVYLSEKETGHKNRALAYMLKAYGMIQDPAEELLDFYFKACSTQSSSPSFPESETTDAA